MKDVEWAREQANKHDKGRRIATESMVKAVEWLEDVLENMNDVAWRKMSIEHRSMEMGISEKLENLYTLVIPEREKALAKMIGDKDKAALIMQIVMAEMIKQMIKEVEHEANTEG